MANSIIRVKIAEVDLDSRISLQSFVANGSPFTFTFGWWIEIYLLSAPICRPGTNRVLRCRRDNETARCRCERACTRSPREIARRAVPRGRGVSETWKIISRVGGSRLPAGESSSFGGGSSCRESSPSRPVIRAAPSLLELRFPFPWKFQVHSCSNRAKSWFRSIGHY